MKLFLTGEIQVGKSTVICRFLEKYPCSLGGFRTVSGQNRPDGGSDVYLVPAGRPGELSREHIVIRRHGLHACRGADVYPAVYDTLGVRLLRETCGCDLIVMDELGTKEKDALEFQAAVLACLDGKTPVLGVVQKRESAFLDRVRSHVGVTLLEVTPENREAVFRSLPPLDEWRER